MKIETRVKKYAELLGRAMDSYERDHPSWRLEVILWLIESGARSLQHYVESKKETAINWGHPFVQWRYAVDWSWDRVKRGDPFTANVSSGILTAANTSTHQAAVRTIASIMVRHVTLLGLRHLTKDVAYEKDGAHFTPILPVELCQVLNGIRSQKKRQLLLEELYRPFSMGAASVDIDEAWLAKPGKVPRVLARRLARANKDIIAPPLKLKIKVDEHPLDLSLIFQIHPLEVDVQRKNAYYPITFGLHFMPELGDGQNMQELLSAPWVDPKTWSKADQRSFWKELLKALREIRAGVVTERRSELSEAVLTVSAKISISAKPSDPSVANAAVQKMLAAFQETGRVIEMRHSFSDAPSEKPGVIADLSKLVHDVETAGTTVEKGRALEILAKALFTSIPGFEIRPNVGTATEEIDLVIVNGSEEKRWKNSIPLILVECKNTKDKCGKNEVVQFIAKLENRRGLCRLGFLISWSGFANTVTKELLRSSRSEFLVVPIDGASIRAAAETGLFLPVLQNAWDEAALS